MAASILAQRYSVHEWLCIGHGKEKKAAMNDGYHEIGSESYAFTYTYIYALSWYWLKNLRVSTYLALPSLIVPTMDAYLLGTEMIDMLAVVVAAASADDGGGGGGDVFVYPFCRKFTGAGRISKYFVQSICAHELFYFQANLQWDVSDKIFIRLMTEMLENWNWNKEHWNTGWI